MFLFIYIITPTDIRKNQTANHIRLQRAITKALRDAGAAHPGLPLLHPHRAALQNFAAVGAEVYRTDLQGSLTFIWQNDTLTVETTADSAELAA
jgi:hypothetical protein